MKKAKRKVAREAKLAARQTPQDAVSAPETPKPDPTSTSEGAKPQKASQISNPYVWKRGADGMPRATDQLFFAPTGQVVCTLDDIPTLKALRLHRERNAERQYGIPVGR